MPEKKNPNAVVLAVPEHLAATREQAAQFIDLLDATCKENPKASDVAALRGWLAKYPDLAQIGGDLGRAALAKLLDTINTSVGLRLSFEAQAQQIARELAGPDPAPAVRLLAESAALCWAYYYDIQFQHSVITGRPDTTTTRAEYWDRMLDRAHRRYLRSLETLARVRRISLPALQVNIAAGGPQLNQTVARGRE